MKIYLATDHAGFALKNQLKEHLQTLSEHMVEDCGAHTYNEQDDYPDFIAPAAQAVSKSPRTSRAIILGGSGQGEAMLANRYARVRAVVYYGGPLDIVSLSREHNDANVLALGARFITYDEALVAIETWLTTTPLSEDKYTRRIKKAEHVSRSE